MWRWSAGARQAHAQPCTAYKSHSVKLSTAVSAYPACTWVAASTVKGRNGHGMARPHPFTVIRSHPHPNGHGGSDPTPGVPFRPPPVRVYPPSTKISPRKTRPRLELRQGKVPLSPMAMAQLEVEAGFEVR